jgi:uncharacterized surface protein with fasciclin (FAS1) repeats
MKKLVVLLFVAALGFSCGGDDETPVVTPPTVTPPALKSIYQIVSDNPDFSILKSAIETAELKDALSSAAIQVTVFAPNNKAFEDSGLPATAVALIDKKILAPILLNHVLGSVVKAADVKTGYVKTLAPSLTATTKYSMYVNTKSGIVLNGDNDKDKPTVVPASVNIAASNGIIHVVNRVILPLKLVNAVKNNEAFGKLLGAVGTQADVLAALNAASATAPLTVFAPVNGAFEAPAVVTLLGNLKPEQVKNVLLYHVADGNKFSSTFTTDITKLPTKFAPQTLDIKKAATGNNFSITDSSGLPAVTTEVDVVCENGVVHAINAVLVPSNP